MTRPIRFQTSDQRHMHLEPWSDRDLDEMAMVTPSDVQKAKAYWQKILPARLRKLLERRRPGA